MKELLIPDYEVLEFILKRTKKGRILTTLEFLHDNDEKVKVGRARLDYLKSLGIVTESDIRGIKVTPYGIMLFNNRTAFVRNDWLMLFVKSVLLPFLVSLATTLFITK